MPINIEKFVFTFFATLLLCAFLLSGCLPGKLKGFWAYEIQFAEEKFNGTMEIAPSLGSYAVRMISFQEGTIELENVRFEDSNMEGEFEMWEEEFRLEGVFEGEQFIGEIFLEDDSFPIIANKLPDGPAKIDRSSIPYLLKEEDISSEEKNIDHAGIIVDLNEESFERGARIYNSNCINCHGTPEMEGSIPLAQKFWGQAFKGGSDSYSMYQTLTRGLGSMPPQLTLTPQEKYDVILYIQEKFIRGNENEQLLPNSPSYLASLPKGTSRGPEAQAYHPWSDMDYGNFLINTYELADEEKGLERFHSPGPVPFPDEDFLKNNFAYKGIAVRLNKGKGGVSSGNSWMVFDHDLMRVAGGWTGEGFIDWEGILLNDAHEIHPRTVGKLHFETPVGPAWANPVNGSFEDPRWRARDGRAFGPLPKEWADYKGLYYHEGNVIISYTVGPAEILEHLSQELNGDETVFIRTLNISPSASSLKMRIAPNSHQVSITGDGGSLAEEEGFHVLNIKSSTAAKIKIFIANPSADNLEIFANNSEAPESLRQYTQGGEAHYPEVLTSAITIGNEDNLFAVDLLSPPFENPWKARMKLSGIDFMEDANKAVVCATDGDVWLISGLTENIGTLKWKRIGSGLFQPLGIKALDEKIYVICRDQLVLLRDLNGDGETDFYESFNHDHQVTDHFHEFAMGLQADKKGNLYYAKSGRHAREALIPQHGTLIKVSADGSKSDIIATGFRAANGVCINPDGSFIVTDQQGYWNPMNRINWVEVDGKEKFYGNMWGYNPPEDTSNEKMEPPMVWVDMEFDRSPSELLWVNSKKWGPLNGRLLSFSYGYGKIQLVLNESINGQRQGGVIDLPGIKFMTGVMRGRFNPKDEHLYACGMSAWGTSQMMRGGGLYRIRYTGKPLALPIELKASEIGIDLTFASVLDMDIAQDIKNYEIETWDLLRSSAYGSDRYNKQKLEISKSEVLQDGKTVRLYLQDIKPVDVMTISYNISDNNGNPMLGQVQNTIHNLRNQSIF